MVLAVSAAVICGQLASSAEEPGPLTEGGHASEVRMHLGRPTFFVDGEPCASPLFSTYYPETRYFKQMASGSGVKTHSFMTNCGMNPYLQSTPVWLGPGEWDFSEMDARARMVLDADPDALIIPRIYIGTPEWYAEQHPEDMQVMHHGGRLYEEPVSLMIIGKNRMFESLASHRWRKDMGKSLAMVVRHIENSFWGPHVAGYQISSLGSEEWYHWNSNMPQLVDYSTHMQAYFAEWLKAKYGTEEALRSAWNDPGASFERVEIPGKTERMGNLKRTFRDPEREMPVIDYYLCWNDLIPDTINYFAGVVKEASGVTKTVGTYYWYFLDFLGNPEMGHNAGHKILADSPNIDYVMQSPPYFDRDLGSGADYYRRPHLSGTLNEKILYYDNDNATFLAPEVLRRMAESQVDSPYAKGFESPEEMVEFILESMAIPSTAQQTIWQWRRNAGMVLADGLYESFFDLHGGYFDHPRLLAELRSLREMLERAVHSDRSSVAEILVVVDETSQAYLPLPYADAESFAANPRISWALMRFQRAFIRSGAPFDCVLMADLSKVDASQYKLVVFVNTWNMPGSARETVRQSFQQPGKTLLWCYAPGYFNGSAGSASLVEDITGMRIAESADETLIEPKMALTEAGRSFMTQWDQMPPEDPLGQDGTNCKLFYVDDEEAEAWDTLPETDYVTLARKQAGDVTSIYAVSAVLSPEFVAALAESAGVHRFCAAGDVLYANRSYVCLNGGSAGDREIRLPWRCNVYDAMTEELYFEGVDRFDTSLMFGETRLFRYEPSEPAHASP